MKKIELKIPNLGEAEDTEIIEISVKVGDKLQKNDPVIVLESEKAAMEVPSDFDGVLKEIMVQEGDSVKEGTVYAILEVKDEPQYKEIKKDQPEIKDINVVERSNNAFENTLNFDGLVAGPAVRKIARELEIDLNKIIGSGKNGSITKDDLKNYIHSKLESNQSNYANLDNLKALGDYEIENQSKIRKAGAKNLTLSWQSIPHVSHFEEADITKAEEVRKALNNKLSFKISPLAYIVNAVSQALKEYPLMNSSLIGEGKLMLKKYINMGIAVNTAGGLVVPVIKNADKLSIEDIGKEIISIAEKAKNKKLLSSDISGATFTISSLGGIGGTGFTPIINPPEVGIIGVSRSRNTIVQENNEYIHKTILPFSLSYDHRVINGVDAGNFMSFIKTFLEKTL